MAITQEIIQAAEILGTQLGTIPDVQEFKRLNQVSQQDAEVGDLENKLNTLYQKLAEQQQNGEALDRAELDQYYFLRQKLQIHPLIQARDNQLETVKGLFAQTAGILTSILGVDYSTFAR